MLARWGHASGRVLRGLDGNVRLRPRRARCTGCGRTHVLLPVTAVLRRADTAGVLWWALVARGLGWGFRRIAARLDRPGETVRAWLRRFGRRFGAVVPAAHGGQQLRPAAGQVTSVIG